jgi:hypothetical protein
MAWERDPSGVRELGTIKVLGQIAAGHLATTIRANLDRLEHRSPAGVGQAGTLRVLGQ